MKAEFTKLLDLVAAYVIAGRAVDDSNESAETVDELMEATMALHHHTAEVDDEMEIEPLLGKGYRVEGVFIGALRLEVSEDYLAEFKARAAAAR